VEIKIPIRASMLVLTIFFIMFIIGEDLGFVLLLSGLD
jgi:hypothetical protein